MLSGTFCFVLDFGENAFIESSQIHTELGRDRRQRKVDSSYLYEDIWRSISSKLVGLSDRGKISISKFVLSLGLQVRILTAACIDVVTLSASSTVATALLECGTKYNARARNQAGHGLGPPHLHAWPALLVATGKMKECAKDDRASLVKHMQEVVALGLDSLAKVVRVCRTKLCYDKTT